MLIKFVTASEDFNLKETNLKIESTKKITNGETVYIADGECWKEIAKLEDKGLIRTFNGSDTPKTEGNVESVGDILPMTTSVERLVGGETHLKVIMDGNEFNLTEAQMVTPATFRKQLLRIGKVIRITNKEWDVILQAWMDMATKINEPSKEEDIIDTVLNYLEECTIYNNISSCTGIKSLYYTKDDHKVVLCRVDNVIHLFEDINKRMMRSILSKYIIGDSIQKRVDGNRVRFWAFSIEKTGIDIEAQMENEEKV